MTRQTSEDGGNSCIVMTADRQQQRSFWQCSTNSLPLGVFRVPPIFGARGWLGWPLASVSTLTPSVWHAMSTSPVLMTARPWIWASVLIAVVDPLLPSWSINWEIDSNFPARGSSCGLPACLGMPNILPVRHLESRDLNSYHNLNILDPLKQTLLLGVRPWA